MFKKLKKLFTNTKKQSTINKINNKKTKMIIDNVINEVRKNNNEFNWDDDRYCR